MADAEVKTSHEDVVDAVRKALFDMVTAHDIDGHNLCDYVLTMAQAYERVAAAGYDY